MIRWREVPVYLHRSPVDFRKSINGLVQLVGQAMLRSPMEEALFVFGARSRDKIKVLYWDDTGFCLWYKRLEKDRFAWPKATPEAVLHLNAEQLDWLLRGLDIVRLTPHAAMTFEVM